MRKYLGLFAAILLWGCDDGDLEIKEISFDEVPLASCTETLTTTVFFKLKEDESLILVLQDGILENIADNEVTSSIPSQSQLYYRFFDDDVSSSYFCNEIPPATPGVERELEATGGTLIITTVEEDLEDGTFAYHHTFTIENLILTNENGEQIVDTNFELGELTLE